MMKKEQCAVLIKQIHTELEKNANNALRQDDLTMSQISVLIELDKAIDKQLELKRLEQLLHVAQYTASKALQVLRISALRWFGLRQKVWLAVVRLRRMHKRLKWI